MPESPTPLDVGERTLSSVHEQHDEGKTAKSFASLTNQPQEPLLKGEGTMTVPTDFAARWTAELLRSLDAKRERAANTRALLTNTDTAYSRGLDHMLRCYDAATAAVTALPTPRAETRHEPQ